MGSRTRRNVNNTAKAQSFTCRLLQDPEYIGYRPKDKTLFRFRFGYSPCRVAQDWFWAYLAVSYTVSEYLTGRVSRPDWEKLRFAFVREKMLERWFDPRFGVEFELTGNKDGRRFRNGMPYDFQEVNLYAPFEVPGPTVPRKPPARKKK